MPKSDAPRKNVQLLHKLKDAPREPGGAAALFGDGSALLEKANKIQGFLKGQKKRTGGHSSKTEWILTAQQMQSELEGAEKELTSCLRSIQTGPDPDLGIFAMEAVHEWQQVSDACRSLRVMIRQQMNSLVGMHLDVRQQGVQYVQDEALQLKQAYQTLKEETEQDSVALINAFEAAQQEMQEAWPSALPNPYNSFTSSGPLRPVLSLSSASVSSTPTHLPLSNNLSKVPATLPKGGLAPIPEQGPQWTIAGDPSEQFWDGDGAGSTSVTAATSAGGAATGAAAAWARDVQQLDDLIACFPLANDTAKARVRVVFAALRQRHQQKLDGWHDEASAADRAAASAGASTSGSDVGSGGSITKSGPFGGWPEDEHSLFVSLRMRCWRDKAGGRGGGGGRLGGASRDALMRQLAVLMPSRTVTELIAHDDWLTNHKIMQRKRRGLLDAWSREKAQFLEDSAALLDEAHQLAAAKAEKAADRLAHELNREVARENLEDLREIALQEARAAAVVHAAALQAVEERQAVLDAQAREETAHNKALVAAYRAELQLKLDQEAVIAAEVEKLTEVERAAQAAVNKARVEWRRAEFLVKQDKVRDAILAAQAELEAREQRLARLRALVAPDVAADPMRVLLPTEASSAVDDKAPGAFKEVFGYTVEQVYKDHRMRVLEALQSAGLHNTNYGRLAIRQALPATQTRTDNLTIDQRQT